MAHNMHQLFASMHANATGCVWRQRTTLTWPIDATRKCPFGLKTYIEIVVLPQDELTLTTVCSLCEIFQILTQTQQSECTKIHWIKNSPDKCSETSHRNKEEQKKKIHWWRWRFSQNVTNPKQNTVTQFPSCARTTYWPMYWGTHFASIISMSQNHLQRSA